MSTSDAIFAMLIRSKLCFFLCFLCVELCFVFGVFALTRQQSL